MVDDMAAAAAAWTLTLADVQERLAPRFLRAEPRRRARAYVRALLEPVARKNGWQLAEAAGETTPHGMQRLLVGTGWDADLVRDDTRAYVAAQLEGVKDFMVTLVLARTNPGAISVARNALRRV